MQPVSHLVRDAHIGSAGHPARKLTLMALAAYANADGSSCYPSVRSLCQATELSRRSVIDAMHWLEREGWIIPDGVLRNSLRRWRINVQQLAHSPSGGAETAPPVVQRLHPRGAETAPPGGAETAPPVVQRLHLRGAETAPNHTIPANDQPIKPINDQKPPDGGDSSAEKDKSGDSDGNRRAFAQQVVDAYNSICAAKGGMSRCAKMTAKRTAAIRARAKDELKSIDAWRRYFAACAELPFLNGDNDRGWTASIDFLIRPDTPNAILNEGKYRSRRQARGAGSMSDKREAMWREMLAQEPGLELPGDLEHLRRQDGLDIGSLGDSFTYGHPAAPE